MPKRDQCMNIVNCSPLIKIQNFLEKKNLDWRACLGSETKMSTHYCLLQIHLWEEMSFQNRLHMYLPNQTDAGAVTSFLRNAGTIRTRYMSEPWVSRLASRRRRGREALVCGNNARDRRCNRERDRQLLFLRHSSLPAAERT